MIKLLKIANDINQQQVDEGFREKALTLAAAAGMAYGGYKKFVPQDRPQKPETVQTVFQKPEVNFDEQFKKSAKAIIDNIEGGYVNPRNLKNPRERFLFRKSGETMFGLDRKRGEKINNTKAGKKFWNLIDTDRNRNPEEWVRNYRGGNLEDNLQGLAIEAIKPEFERLFNTHLTPESQRIVKSDPRLFLHFAYAVWNGAGHFVKFAKRFNERVKKGNTNPDKLFNQVIEDRISKGGLFKDKADEVKRAAEQVFKSSY